MSANDSKPETQSVNAGGVNAHGGMGEQPQQTQQGIPAYIVAEGQRQAEHGATFFAKKLADCTREELYGAVVAAWYEAHILRNELAAAGKASENDDGA